MARARGSGGAPVEDGVVSTKTPIEVLREILDALKPQPVYDGQSYQKTVTTTALRLVEKDDSRRLVTIRNSGSVALSIFLGSGGPGMAAGAVFTIGTGASMTFDGLSTFHGEIWGITASSSTTVEVLAY